MVLPTNFPISTAQINVELGRSATAAFSMTGSTERGLAQKPTGPVKMSDFLGKSNGPVIVDQGLASIPYGSSSVTITGVTFGANYVGRTLVCCVGGNLTEANSSHAAMDTITIGGSAATVKKNNKIGSTTFASAGSTIGWATPAGTSGSLVLATSSVNTSINNNPVELYWFLLSVPNLGAQYVSDTSSGGTGSNDGAMFLSNSTGGFVIAVAAIHKNAAHTWTGLTLRGSYISPSSNFSMSMAYDSGVPAGTDLSGGVTGMAISWHCAGTGQNAEIALAFNET